MKRIFSALAWAVVFGLALIAGHATAQPSVSHVSAVGELGLMVGFAGMIINAENLSAMFNGFKAAFSQTFNAVQPVWNKVATLVPSTSKVENYGWLSEFPRLREWIGDREINSLAASGYSITNKPFEASVGVSRDDIDDDTYGVFAPLFSEMGYAAATHPDELVFALLAAGFTTKCFDGQYFFDTDHPVGESGTASNFQGGSGTPWFLLDTRRPLKPLIFQKRRDYALTSMTDAKDEGVFMRNEYRYGVDARCNVGYGFWQMAYASKQTLDETNYGAARAAMMAMKSDAGRPLGISPSILVVPPSLEAAALKLVQAEANAAGATNIYRNSAEVLVVPWLA